MTTSNFPKVTVFIPVYNRERYIQEAVDSILAQSFPDFELLLIDDGSTDSSVAIMNSYTDPRIRLVRNECNLGIPHTRNRGLQLARGEYIALLDSDDYAYPDRLNKQVAFLDAHPDYAEIGSWSRAMDEQSRPLKKIKVQPVSSEEVKAHLLFRCCLNNRTIMGRTAILREYGYRNDFPRCQDYELHVRLAGKYKLGNLPAILVRGRVHKEQITGQTAELGRAKKQEIADSQLTTLGLAYSNTDLRRHVMLTRIGKLPFTPDQAYLKWADDWLRKLQQANRITSLHPEPAFSRVLGEIWFRTCFQTSAAIGLAAWAHFWRSPLCRYAAANVGGNLRALISGSSRLKVTHG